MKVLLVNGSPNEHGCTATALREVSKTLEECGVDADVFWIGKKPLSGCINCGTCGTKGECVFGDRVNDFTRIAGDYDGFVFGSPVYYSGMNGSLMSFMDRVFYSASSKLAFKPAAAVVSARRAGTTSTLDQINKYFMINQMPVVSSRYWNMVHGNTPEQVAQDKEGLQIMRVLGRNMAWLLKLREAGEKAGVEMPKQEEERFYTNFIR